MAKKTILQALRENQDKLTNLDVNFLLGKIKDKDYSKRREKLRLNVKKILKDKNLLDNLKYPHLSK